MSFGCPEAFIVVVAWLCQFVLGWPPYQKRFLSGDTNSLCGQLMVFAVQFACFGKLRVCLLGFIGFLSIMPIALGEMLG